ncbi:regulatory protein RecX [Candidatus Gottesmanbacteria bacterium]|nr:regulatory protein RecX [Candidatus Gottesmanbacteria bacterium]
MDEIYAKLLESSIRFVSFRPRSEKEFKYFLLKKLQRRKISDVRIIDRVLTRLRELGYADDAKFVSWWVDQRQSHKPKGARLIARELKAKGISLDIDTHDEVALARRAVEKKLLLWHKLPKLEQKKKLYGFLGRRGFDGETIHRVIDELVDDRVQ